jgi:hypothetical protein
VDLQTRVHRRDVSGGVVPHIVLTMDAYRHEELLPDAISVFCGTHQTCR